MYWSVLRIMQIKNYCSQFTRNWGTIFQTDGRGYYLFAPIQTCTQMNTDIQTYKCLRVSENYCVHPSRVLWFIRHTLTGFLHALIHPILRMGYYFICILPWIIRLSPSWRKLPYRKGLSISLGNTTFTIQFWYELAHSDLLLQLRYGFAKQFLQQTCLFMILIGIMK